MIQTLVDTPLLFKHRNFLKFPSFDIYKNSENNSPTNSTILKYSFNGAIAGLNEIAYEITHALNGPQEGFNAKEKTSKFKEELSLVVEAHKSFVKMFSPKISNITQKKY